MTSYKHFILPAVLVGTTAVASAFTTFMASRLRNRRRDRQQAMLADRKVEGCNVEAAGSVHAPSITEPVDDLGP